jgi:hypothetical protein
MKTMERLEPNPPLASIERSARLVGRRVAQSLLGNSFWSGEGGGVQEEHRRVVAGLVG